MVYVLNIKNDKKISVKDFKELMFESCCKQKGFTKEDFL